MPFAAASSGRMNTFGVGWRFCEPVVSEKVELRKLREGLVESRNGMLFEVGPGSNLPGLGKVETIKRENGRLVVVAKNGIITAMSEPRRPPGSIPYRY